MGTKMDNQNHALIKELIAVLHSEKLLKSYNKYFSPNFQFDSPEQGGLDFEQMCAYFSTISYLAQVRIDKISTAGPIYRAAIVCNIIDYAQEYFSDLHMDAIFKIENNLISSIHTEYEATLEELEYFEKANIKLPTKVID